MTQKDTSGPAFPCDRVPLLDGNIVCAPGITTRDYFAAKAMQSYVAHNNAYRFEDMAAMAYRMADAMLKEREK